MLTPRQKVIICTIFTGYMACVNGFLLSVLLLYFGTRKLVAFNVYLIESGWLDIMPKSDKYASAAIYSGCEMILGMILYFVALVICRIVMYDIETIKTRLKEFDAEANKKHS